MSRLEYYCRPLVAFDPTNKDHRRFFAEFQMNHTWGTCPVRFIVPEDNGDLVTLMQRSLIQYYIDREFQVSRRRKK
jgi:hypothetical protein